jgi:hypothetical protein
MDLARDVGKISVRVISVALLVQLSAGDASAVMSAINRGEFASVGVMRTEVFEDLELFEGMDSSP